MPSTKPKTRTSKPRAPRTKQPAKQVTATPPPAPVQPEAKPADVETIELGTVQGRLTLTRPDVVLSLLDDEFRNRIERQRALPSVLELQERVRASEGRCAPIIVTGDESTGEAPPSVAFFHGADTLAAAINLSLERVAVVMIAPGDAGAVQSYLVQQLHQAKPTPSEDDDLMWRVNATDF